MHNRGVIMEDPPPHVLYLYISIMISYNLLLIGNLLRNEKIFKYLIVLTYYINFDTSPLP